MASARPSRPLTASRQITAPSGVFPGRQGGLHGALSTHPANTGPGLIIAGDNRFDGTNVCCCMH